MSFPTLTVTNAGKAMMVKALNGQTVNFSKVKVGSGAIPADILTMTDLANPLQNVDITSFTLGTNSITVNFVFTNESAETAFSWTEVGLFANAGDGEVLFAYANAGEDAETIPASSSAYYEENTYSLTIVVDNTANLTATVKSLTYATKEDFENHLKDFNNPHRVTKEQIGLGNVQNVETNDQTPTVSAADVLTELKNGDTMKTIIGKLAKAVSDLKAHINTFGKNVHQETAASIGAAASKHSHAAADIVGGTLGTARGGTGRESWTENGLVYATNEASLGQVGIPTADSILMQGASGSPYFRRLDAMNFFQAGTTAPSQKNILWIDTTSVTGGLKYHNGTAWVHVPVAYTE